MPRTARPIPVAALAEFIGCEVEGDAGATVHGFASLDRARADELVFLRSSAHRAALESSRARVVLAAEGVEVGQRTALRTPRPDHDFSRLMIEFASAVRPDPGVKSGAHVDATARVDATASIAAGAIVGPGSRVGARTVVAANVTLVRDVRIGDDCWIHSGVVVCEDTKVGNRVVLNPGVVLGGAGFGLVADESGKSVSVPQRGRVVVEDDVEIGANSTVDRATLDETRIRRGAKIDNLVQIAHNCDIGEGAVIVAQTGLAGGTVVGSGAIVMAQVGASGHLKIGKGAFVAARAGLHRDVADGARVYGSPQMEEKAWHRISASLKRLPELLRRVRRLESALENRAGDDGSSEGDSDAD